MLSAKQLIQELCENSKSHKHNFIYVGVGVTEDPPAIYNNEFILFSIDKSSVLIR